MKFNFEATGVGSVPFVDPKESCEKIVNVFEDIPFWPQLPKRSYLENMYVQYAEGFPGIFVDEKNRTVFVDREKALGEIEPFYERCIANDVDSFAISPERAQGFYEFLSLIRQSAWRGKFVKGHITGPVSFALTITDQNKKSIIYDTELFECAIKILSMKVIWQIRKLKELSSNVIIFIDEPHLVSIGSGYINIDAQKAKERIEELIAVIKKENVLCGIHCCGNTDWPFLLSRSIDILNFDAYNFIKQFIIFDKDIKSFLKKDGAIAWGVVPTADGSDEKKGNLAKKVQEAEAQLAKKGIDRELFSSLVTPSCGVGTQSAKRAQEILNLTKEVSCELKDAQ